MYEYTSINITHATQMQYIAGNDKMSIGVEKQSPPLALRILPALGSRGAEPFDRYLDLMIDFYLDDFASTCFEEEDSGDELSFQTELLQLLTNLYKQLGAGGDKSRGKNDLGSDLRSLLKMLIVTFITGHTLTIKEESLQSVVCRLDQASPLDRYGEFTSPRLANMQLKLFFAAIRNDIFDKIMRRIDSILRSGGPKEGSCIQAFCTLLMAAMALEECQHTIHIHLDSMVNKDQMSRYDADSIERRECQQIDYWFAFMVNLFHCKYREKNRTSAQLADYGEGLREGTPEWVFVYELIALAQRKCESPLVHPLEQGILLTSYVAHILRERKDLPIAPGNDRFYTSRLVGQLLADFVNLDGLSM